MKKIIIKEGHHRPLSIIPPFVRNMRFDRNKNQIIGYELLFDGSCGYLLNNGDQNDWNKIYGWGFGLNHHKNSTRLVWRYNPIEQVIEVAPYCYIDGKCVLPTKSQIIQIKIGEKIRTSIEILGNTARVIIESDITTCQYDIKFSDCKKKPLFGCWFYFGGNKKAPHDIVIRYKKNEGSIATLF